MTENFAPEHIDLFLRQALIGGNRVPVLWGGNFNLLAMLHNHADADVGEFGNGMDGIVPIESAEHAKTLHTKMTLKQIKMFVPIAISTTPLNLRCV